jgi:Xaa-Pro aminopeptidase
MESELRAYEEIRRIAKPGVKLVELSNTFERVLIEDGWEILGDQPGRNDFHNQGMDVIEWPVLGTADARAGDALLEEGMIFSYHPKRRVLPEVRSMGINENMLITAHGGERLSEPWDLRWRVRTE